jgi:hypothetical protein
MKTVIWVEYLPNYDPSNFQYVLTINSVDYI